jgi:hypothetical protein
MKNVVLWGIKPSSYLAGDITSPLQSPGGYCYVRFEVFTAVIMKNFVFWDIKTQFVPHRRYVSATESSQLMI